MKCPIKDLESECIEKECPLYFQGCGLSSLVTDIGSISDFISNIDDQLDITTKVLYEGLRR